MKFKYIFVKDSRRLGYIKIHNYSVYPGSCQDGVGFEYRVTNCGKTENDEILPFAAFMHKDGWTLVVIE